MRRAMMTLAVVAALAAPGCKKDEAPAAPPAKDEAKKDEAKKDEAKKDEPKDEAKKDEPAKDAAKAGPKAVQVAAGNGAACALMDDGTVRCWGRNDFGELGLPKSNDDAATPVQVPGVTDATWIVMGGDPGSASDIACVGRKDESVWCWGHTRLFPDNATDGAPRAVLDLKGIKALATGGGTIYAVWPDGSVKGWGSAAFNSFGESDPSNSSDKPITQIPNVAGAVGVAAGQNHACALLGDGTVKCWGYVNKKQDATLVEGVTDAKAIWAATQGGETCVSHGDTSVTCWTDYAAPAKKGDLAGATAIAGRGHLCALLAGGTVKCWGSNDRGQLGNGQVGSMSNAPVAVQGITDAVSIATGANTSCAALKDGTVKCWGYNQRGQLGDGTLMDRATPVTVAGLNEATLSAPGNGLNEVQQASTPMDWEGMPAACKKGDLALNLKKWEDKSLTVISAYAQSQWEGKTITVDIANYLLDPAKLFDAPRGRQLKVGLRFAKVDLQSEKKEPQPVDAGEYSLDTKTERYVMPTLGIKTGGMMFMSISLDGVKAGTATIDHLDDTWVCGELKLTAGEESITGPYAARIAKK
ncbi:MAG: hypothetical protein AMXMBFR64_15860 [Myxococcales bacterium]